MKAHKYWSVGALITMIGTFYTGYKGLKAAHKYFAFGSLICMIMAVYSGHKMISGNKKNKKTGEKYKSGGIVNVRVRNKKHRILNCRIRTEKCIN